MGKKLLAPKTTIMRTSNFLTLLCVVIFSSHLMAQQSIVNFSHFIEQHHGLDNASGELVPIGISEIEMKINFFIEEKFPDFCMIIFYLNHLMLNQKYLRVILSSN